MSFFRCSRRFFTSSSSSTYFLNPSAQSRESSQRRHAGVEEIVCHWSVRLATLSALLSGVFSKMLKGSCVVPGVRKTGHGKRPGEQDGKLEPVILGQHPCEQ